VVELAVTSAAETVDDPASGRVFDGSHAGIGGELVTVGESSGVTGVADQSASQDGANSVDVRQGRPRCQHRILDSLVGGLQLGIEALHVVKELVGQVITGPLHRGDWIEVIVQPNGVRSVEFLGDSTW
jgi:hypothetical protein